ncbi:UDP-3-O-acyl-N-acetylglucosamine deacetylase [soil metagenome]
MMQRRTLKSAVSIAGRGIHSGIEGRVLVQPQPAGSGIRFQRAGREPVAASWQLADAKASDRRTVIIGPSGERFEQIEHLMAAFAAMGISDALVEQEGPEVPFLGGGSREYMEQLRAAGVADLAEEIAPLEITRPVSFRDGDALLTATPHNGLRLSCFVEFPGTVVGSDGFSLEITEESFFEQASRARTFALARDLELLRQAGLIKGGDLSNAVVFDAERYYNESLHYPNEVVRHKVIDLLGDLALLGLPLRGHFWAWRAGHRSHVLFAKFLAEEFLKP